MPIADVNNCPLVNEYIVLKNEQTARVGFRDNLIYVTLGAFGSLTAFSLADDAHLYALLVIPWVSFILGWTYLVNDEKVTAIGTYIRTDLLPLIAAAYPDRGPLLQWETAHKSDRHRRHRKLIQLFVDQLTFFGPGAASIVAFALLVGVRTVPLASLVVSEGLLCLFLAAEICLYADTRSISQRPPEPRTGQQISS